MELEEAGPMGSEMRSRKDAEVVIPALCVLFQAVSIVNGNNVQNPQAADTFPRREATAPPPTPTPGPFFRVDR
ncbi:hypothetical protein EYF80_059058 [Liparis tanakae]|uniref:Uncharacterized protein n=1 Tax=Liparis tanakae TaxID=230148 RepID=A0A4Z2EQ98_9TELE|nr:hypothetical protein EYF80_059058 [Liparis tanakae]